MVVLQSPGRRVLGDKTTNASLRKHTSKSTQGKSSASIIYAQLDGTVDAVDTIKWSPKIGSKRPIAEVDDSHDREPEDNARGPPTPASTDLLGDGASTEGSSQSAPATRPLLSVSSLLGSFHASQEPPAPLEDQFEIQEEMSQQTLDKIHATPLPQNNSQPDNPPRSSLPAENSQESVRMSSFIDFESAEDDTADLLPISPSKSTSLSCTNIPDQATISEKAAALRTRLELAMYKVRTNQVGRPLSRLEMPPPPRCLSPELPPQITSSVVKGQAAHGLLELMRHR